jgi:transcriptional regulator of acetoin/glycerol metabolism
MASLDDRFDLDLLPASFQKPILKRFLLESEGDAQIETDDLSETARPRNDVLESALRSAKGNIKLAAQENGWHRTQLYRWLRQAGIDPGAFRPPDT